MDFISSWPKSFLCHLCSLLVLLPYLCFASAASSLPDQCASLLKLREGFSSSDLPSWVPGTDCCRDWEGVSCDKSSNGHVIALDLSDRHIEGSLSAAIFNLTSLQYLNLAYNYFQDPIPTTGFEKLTMLTHLNLSFSNFSGQIPIGISKLTNLASLDLSCDSYSFPLWLRKPNLRTLVSNLSSLRELHLDGVDVSENGAEWCGALSESVPLLQVLSMTNCNLRGPIEPSLSQLHYLSIIHLSFNHFNSPIPEYFVNFPLNDLQLYECKITGFLPINIFHIPTLKILDLSYNEDLHIKIPDFSLGSSLESLCLDDTIISNQIIPDSIENLRNLSKLSLWACNFSGQILSHFTKLTNLVFLDLSGNSLSGSIPQALLTLPKLNYLFLTDNKFSGQFRLEEESSIWFSPLTDLYLGQNQLNGSIPQAIYKFYNLKYLSLNMNQFSGPIPNTIFKLSSLIRLYLDSNKFNGTFDFSLLQHLPNLTDLYLSHNQLSLQDISDEQLRLPFPKIDFFGLASCKLRKIPRISRYSDDIVDLDLSNNQLHGIIPSWFWENLYYSMSLNLSRNMVEGVPLCPGPRISRRFINSIDLSYNNIKGALPLVSGRYLDYSNNEFSEIPSNYTLYLNQTVFLSLATNKLTGEIPSSFCEIPLAFLDVSNNDMSGLIPSCILGASNLLFMNLASNRFHGIVPRNISKSCGLVILYLSNNNLNGDLPRSLARCNQLLLLDIGNNNITGTFPFWLGKLSNLQVIILRSNQFDNAFEIPPKFESNNSIFQNMRIIDLASNNLNGTLLPSLFKNFKSMVNLSFYELTTEAFSRSISKGNYYYFENYDITIIDKGIQMILKKHIASIMVEIDLSDNRFTGDIPESISMLSALKALNLSHNALTGSIPGALKGLTQIESLDLSWNSLSGEIPQELTSIDSLSTLNLSFNHLSGRIPESRKFFDNSSFEGNPGLCGVPLSKQCNATNQENNFSTVSTVSSKKMMTVVILCLFIGSGFGTGFAIVSIWSVIKSGIKGSGTY